MQYVTPEIGGMIVGAGILLFSLTALFQLVTLPTEFNASSRALKTLEDAGILYEEEITGARRVLSAAAMTYVAAALSSLAMLLYYAFIILARSRGRD
jgi:Zn-dependent membrane protease YugP